MSDRRVGTTRSDDDPLTAEFELIDVDFEVPTERIERQPNPRQLLSAEALSTHMHWLEMLRRLSDPSLFPKRPR